MAEMYHLSTGHLMESGKTESEIRSLPWFDPSEHGVSDTGQVFDPWPDRSRKFENWNYVAFLNQYFRSEPTSHAWLKAAKTLFTEERWEEIKHRLETMDVHRWLARFDLPTLRKKVLKLRDAGVLTAAEVQTLAQIFGS